jgi:hypothetical protein
MLVAACLLLAACGDNLPTYDGSIPLDGGVGDLPVPSDGSAALAGAFTVIGCSTLDQSMVSPRCTATAPAELTFVPLAAGVTDFVWSFPGGTPSSSRAITPTVVYAQAGSFTVTLAAGGPGGTTVSSGMVVIGAGATSAACMHDSDCDVASGLACVCGDGACPGGLAVGLCSRSCAPGSCAPGEVCADLARGFTASADGGAPDGGGPDAWRHPLCLRGCTSDTDCRVGLHCREVPSLAPGVSEGGAFTWKKACFADALGDVGDACAGASGAPEADRCLSGRCDPLGARDVCTADCASTSCPSYAACATFNATPAVHTCLRRCSATEPCDDPLLACVPAGGAGGFGFTIMPPDPTAFGFCAPKPCTMASDCAPAGVCTSSSGASFCTKS